MTKRQTHESPAPAAAPRIKDARQRRSRQALHTALLTLVEQKPLDQITIRDIAAEAGVGYATFFRHYPSKDDLLNDIASAEIKNLVEVSLRTLNAADTRSSCETLCSYVMEHRALWTALLVGGASGLMRDAFIRTARDVTMARTEYKAKTWLPTDLGIFHSTNAIISMLSWWLSQPKPLSVKRIADIMDRLIVRPVLEAEAPEA